MVVFQLSESETRTAAVGLVFMPWHWIDSVHIDVGNKLSLSRFSHLYCVGYPFFNIIICPTDVVRDCD